MDKKEIRNLKWSLNVCYWWLNFLSLVSFGILLLFSNNPDGLTLSDFELAKHNSGLIILRCFIEDQIIIIFGLCILIFSYGSIKEPIKNWDNYQQLQIFRWFIFGCLLYVTIDMWDKFISSRDVRIVFSYFYFYQLLIQFIVMSILSIFVRNYKDKILSTMDEKT